MFKTKWWKSCKKNAIKGVAVFLIAASISVPGFSDTSTTQGVNDENAVEVIGLDKLKQSFIENSTDLRTLKDAQADIGRGIDTYDLNVYYIVWLKDTTTGKQNDTMRSGKYYEYAFPNFVSIENYKVQLNHLEITQNMVEAKLSNAADQYVLNYKLLSEKIELYDKMIERTKKLDATIQDKVRLGLLTKRDEDNSRLELENLKLEREQLSLSKDALKDTILSMSTYDEGKNYEIQLPTFTLSDFNSDNLGTYYDSAIELSQNLADLNRVREALEYEGNYIDLYRSVVLKSDIKDHEIRVLTNQNDIDTAKKTIYNKLKSELSELNTIEDSLKAADIEIAYNKSMLKKLENMESLGLVVDTDRMGYELKVFQSELQKKSLETNQFLIGQKLELLIYFGIEI